MGPLSNATYARRYLYPLHARLRESIKGLGKCSWCGALKGELCRTPGGERRFPHVARTREG